ncbi:hypothetical protein Fot_12607 [Forsythia ovata]|uniref:Uncharacterized protein n=1 Tax=Forsythia ovata TaxID=205694 RepID=A0ABD1WN51_9LAMI
MVIGCKSILHAVTFHSVRRRFYLYYMKTCLTRNPRCAPRFRKICQKDRGHRVPSRRNGQIVYQGQRESPEGEAPHLCQRHIDHADCKSRDMHEWQDLRERANRPTPKTDLHNISVKICPTQKSNMRCRRISLHGIIYPCNPNLAAILKYKIRSLTATDSVINYPGRKEALQPASLQRQDQYRQGQLQVGTSGLRLFVDENLFTQNLSESMNPHLSWPVITIPANASCNSQYLRSNPSVVTSIPTNVCFVVPTTRVTNSND